MEKGQLGYIRHQKHKHTVLSLSIFIIIVVIWIIRESSSEIVYKYLTLAIGLSILPLSLFLSKLVVFFFCKSLDKSLLALDKHKIDRNILVFDVLLVVGKTSKFIPVIGLNNDTLHYVMTNKWLEPDIIKSLFKSKGYVIDCVLHKDMDSFYLAIKDAKMSSLVEDYKKVIYNNSI